MKRSKIIGFLYILIIIVMIIVLAIGKSNAQSRTQHENSELDSRPVILREKVLQNVDLNLYGY